MKLAQFDLQESFGWSVFVSWDGMETWLRYDRCMSYAVCASSMRILRTDLPQCWLKAAKEF